MEQLFLVFHWKEWAMVFICLHHVTQLQRINCGRPTKLATRKIWGDWPLMFHLGDLTEIHLPHKASLDKARDLRVLIFSADICRVNDCAGQQEWKMSAQTQERKIIWRARGPVPSLAKRSCCNVSKNHHKIMYVLRLKLSVATTIQFEIHLWCWD